MVTESNLTPEVVLAHGYKEYPVPSVYNCDRFFQKWIKEKDTKLYSINLLLYNRAPHGTAYCGWSIKARLYHHRNVAFDLDLFWEPPYTVEFIEQFYRTAYTNMRCIEDQHNND